MRFIERRERGKTVAILLTAFGVGIFIGGLLAPGLGGWPELVGFAVGMVGLLLHDRVEWVCELAQHHARIRGARPAVTMTGIAYEATGPTGSQAWRYDRDWVLVREGEPSWRRVG